jgi:hypothetical protein
MRFEIEIGNLKFETGLPVEIGNRKSEVARCRAITLFFSVMSVRVATTQRPRIRRPRLIGLSSASSVAVAANTLITKKPSSYCRLPFPNAD